ncbi:hypothetical protein [Variovorax sp. RCC_210]|uniref:hypothetical protein n=1 Tax=Variovorax sp. RCC_210 TaxID=3239217 RepID=UPI003523AB8A
MQSTVKAAAGVRWVGCNMCDWSGWSDECEQDGSVAKQGDLCPECFSTVAEASDSEMGGAE